jgi:predicted nicotinamide N-methyase
MTKNRLMNLEDRCFACGNPAVFFTPGRMYCPDHFFKLAQARRAPAYKLKRGKKEEGRK